MSPVTAIQAKEQLEFAKQRLRVLNIELREKDKTFYVTPSSEQAKQKLAELQARVDLQKGNLNE